MEKKDKHVCVRSDTRDGLIFFIVNYHVLHRAINEKRTHAAKRSRREKDFLACRRLSHEATV